MTEITRWQFFKKRLLYYLGGFFIYIVPFFVILEKLITIRSNSTVVSVTFVGFFVGIIYIFFVAKKIKAKTKELKPGPLKVCIGNILNIIPFATVGCLVVLVEKALKRGSLAVWFICISMLVGTIMQTVEYAINRKFLYKLRIEELAKEQADVEIRKKELLEELENESE